MNSPGVCWAFSALPARRLKRKERDIHVDARNNR
jgi:hypothetical protein